MKPRVARHFAQAISRIIMHLPYEEKCSLISQTIHAIIQQQRLEIASNLIILLLPIIDSIMSDNIIDIYNRYYGNILAITVAIIGQIDNQLKIVSAMNEQFDQKQLNKLQLLQQTMRDALQITIKMLQKANQEQQTYYMMLQQLNNSVHFRQMMEQGMNVNIPGAQSIILVSQLKQTESFNEFKSILMRIANEVFPMPMDSLFQLVLKTLEAGNNTTDTAVKCVLAECLCMLSRWLDNNKTYTYFHENMVDTFYCMFKYAVSNSQQIELMEDKPEIFNQKARQCCQDVSTTLQPKQKAIKFLSEMCTKIDGAFSRVAQTLMIIIDSSLMTPSEQHSKYHQFLKQFQAYGIDKLTIQSRIEACLLIIASLTSNFLQRQQLKLVMIKMIEYRMNQMVAISPLVINRFILFTAYNPFVHFLQHFPKLIQTNQANMLQITWVMQFLLKKKMRKDVQQFIQTLLLELITHVSCLHKIFHVIVQDNFQQISNVDATNIVLNRIGKEIQINFKHRPRQLVSNINQLCNILIHVLNKIRQPTTYDKTICQILNFYGLDEMCDSSLIDLAVAYIDRAQHLNNYQRLFVREIRRSSSALMELYNRHLLYSNQLGWLADQIAQLMKITVDETQLWQLAVLAQLAVHQSTNFQSISCILQRTKNKMMETSNKVLQHRMLLVFLAVCSKYKQVSLISEAMDSERYLETLLCKKTYCLHMMNLALLQVNSDQLPQIIRIVCQTIMKIHKLQHSDMDVETPYQGDSLKVFARLRWKHFRHPILKIDLFQAFREMWQNLVRLKENVGEVVDRQAVRMILQNRIVGDKPRVVMKIKR